MTTFWCFFLSQAADLASAKEKQQQFLCCIVATGVYPTLCITDACTIGSASSNSKMHIWKLFSLDALNEFLERDPTPGELTYKVPTRHRWDEEMAQRIFESLAWARRRCCGLLACVVAPCCVAPCYSILTAAGSCSPPLLFLSSLERSHRNRQ